MSLIYTYLKDFFKNYTLFINNFKFFTKWFSFLFTFETLFTKVVENKLFTNRFNRFCKNPKMYNLFILIALYLHQTLILL